MSQDNMEQMGEHCFVLINQMSFKGINQPQKLTNEHVWEQQHHKHEFIMNLDYPKHSCLPKATVRKKNQGKVATCTHLYYSESIVSLCKFMISYLFLIV